MGDPVEGRWLINFGAFGNGLTANEAVFSDKEMVLAINGKRLGRYTIDGDGLNLTIPMPHDDDEPPWEMVGRFDLPAVIASDTVLRGQMTALLPSGEPMTHECLLERRAADA